MNPNCLSDLKTLHLQELGTTNCISTSQLIVALRASPGLADLRLGKNAVRVDEFTGYNYMTPVDLPYLTCLSLEIQPQSAHDILTLLRVPSCAILKITSTGAPNIEVLDARTTHISTVVRSILAKLDIVTVELGPSLVSLRDR